MKKAVFLDKDGTVIRDVPFNVNPAHIELDPYAPEALKLLQQHGYELWLVTNQPGIARRYFSEAALAMACECIASRLKSYGVDLAGCYYCPHDEALAAGSSCQCRKPMPGMLLQAASEHNIDLAASWMIGDILHDVEAGNRAGCQTILIDNGHETEWQINTLRQPAYIAANLVQAADCIIQCIHDEQPVEPL